MFREKIGAFRTDQCICNDSNLEKKPGSILNKKRHFFAKILLKVITSVPGQTEAFGFLNKMYQTVCPPNHSCGKQAYIL
jgi:hypothetical protein